MPQALPSGEHGVDLAIAHRDDWWWSPAWAAVRWLAKTRRTFTVDDLRGVGVGVPDAPCRWGALLAAARRSRLIEPCGAAIAADGRLVRVWTAVGGDL